MRRTDTRPLTVYGNTWEYKIGRNTIAIYDPEGNRYFPKFTDIMGDRSIENYSPHLNPAAILNYIQVSILDKKWETVRMNRCAYCKEEGPDVIYQVNPYASVINGDNTKHFMCNDCFDESAEEI